MKFTSKNTLTGGLTGLLNTAEPQAVKAGLTKAGLAIWGDSVNLRPKPPLDTGLLRGSVNVQVEGVAITSPPPGVEIKSEAAVGNITAVKGRLFFGFNTPYATKLHEQDVFVNPSDPDSGPNFLGSKLAAYNQDYYSLVAEGIRDYLAKK